MNATKLPTTTELAAVFSEKVRGYLTPEQLELVRTKNANETDTRICHSHDYFDANEAMIAALEHFGLDLFSDDEAEQESRMALANGAWDIAKAGGFR